MGFFTAGLTHDDVGDASKRVTNLTLNEDTVKRGRFELPSEIVAYLGVFAIFLASFPVWHSFGVAWLTSMSKVASSSPTPFTFFFLFLP